jgi:hypothetical protein
MVSPVRIRVPPLTKVLQIEEKDSGLAALPGTPVNSPLTKRFFRGQISTGALGFGGAHSRQQAARNETLGQRFEVARRFVFCP